jgi:hypothetical protein
VMSPALRLMAVQNFGLKGGREISGDKFEERMCRYFYFLFQAAFLIPEVIPGFTDVTVLLRKDWTSVDPTRPNEQVPPHGMQLRYNDSNFQEANVDTLPLCKAATSYRSQSRCTPSCFQSKLQPLIGFSNPTNHKQKRKILQAIASSKSVSSLAETIKKEFPSMHELMLQSRTTDVLIVKNGSKASFADLLIVNNRTKELWLIQCKSLLSEGVKVNVTEELAKMGYPGNSKDKHAARLYREALKCALGMATVRYFFCILVAPTLDATRGKKVFPIDLVRAQFTLPLPPDVYVLSNAFGFQFTPMNLDDLVDDGADMREWLEEADLKALRTLLANNFRRPKVE